MTKKTRMQKTKDSSHLLPNTEMHLDVQRKWPVMGNYVIISTLGLLHLCAMWNYSRLQNQNIFQSTSKQTTKRKAQSKLSSDPKWNYLSKNILKQHRSEHCLCQYNNDITVKHLRSTFTKLISFLMNQEVWYHKVTSEIRVKVWSHVFVFLWTCQIYISSELDSAF